MPGLSNPGARIYVPDGTGPDAALSRTTHLGVGAHADDLPIMALDGIGRCFGHDDRWFTGITVTDGAGSPRAGRYAGFTDEQMREVRIHEETQAADTGAYSAAVLLDYSSSAVTNPSNADVVSDLAAVIGEAEPGVVYTHNPADKHDTHVAVALRTVAAIRRLPADARPAVLFGCEVWGDLDWMVDEDRVAFDVAGHGELMAAVLGSYESQRGGGRRYDLGVAGRNLAHATFSDPYASTTPGALAYAMDLTPLISDDAVAVEEYVDGHVQRLRGETIGRIERLQGRA